MRMKYFGDSYDFVKRVALATIGSGATWDAFPMFTEHVSDAQVRAYEKFVGVTVLAREPLTPAPFRENRFSASAEHRHVFLDPNTGVRLRPQGGKAGTDRVLGREIAALCSGYPDRVVVVFDQAFAFGSAPRTLGEKLHFFEAEGIYGFAYLSHACLLVLSENSVLCERAYDRLLSLHLPEKRLLRSSGVVDTPGLDVVKDA